MLEYPFYVWNEHLNEVCLMRALDSDEKDLNSLNLILRV